MVHNEADASGGFGVFAQFLEDHPDLSAFGLDNAISYVHVFEAQRAIIVRDHRHKPSANRRSTVVWARDSTPNGRFVPGHWEPIPASGPPANPTVVVSPTRYGPNLLYMRKLDGTPWTNPTSADTSDPNWSRKVVGGATFDRTAAHPFEWVSVLNPKAEQDDQVGLTGRVVHPHQSGADLPFTHPFGPEAPVSPRSSNNNGTRTACSCCSR